MPPWWAFGPLLLPLLLGGCSIITSKYWNAQITAQKYELRLVLEAFGSPHVSLRLTPSSDRTCADYQVSNLKGRLVIQDGKKEIVLPLRESMVAFAAHWHGWRHDGKDAVFAYCQANVPPVLQPRIPAMGTVTLHDFELILSEGGTMKTLSWEGTLIDGEWKGFQSGLESRKK